MFVFLILCNSMMEAIIPSDVLNDIFTRYISVEDAISVYNTCKYWRNVMDNFNVWGKLWFRLLARAEKTCLKDQTCDILNQLNPENIDLPYACSKLFTILYNTCINSKSCSLNKNKRFDAVLLKTHYSHYILSFYEIQEELNEVSIIHQLLNTCNPDEVEYIEFRSPGEVIMNNNVVHICKDKTHTYLIKQFFYVYPMELANFIESDIISHWFDVYHVQELVLIPRVVMLCENLNACDALVIFSTSQSTEIAVVLNGSVAGDRWCEIPVGGWNVSKYLHSAIQWIYQKVARNVYQMEDEKFKNLCWIKPFSNMSNSQLKVHTKINNSYITLKKEQYLAPELMYNELDLCSVVQRLFKGLSDADVSNCLSHVFLTGGNCKLKHLNTRIKSDLIQTFPKHQHIISTSVHCEPSLIYELTNNVYSNVSSLTSNGIFTAGNICKIRIEDYITCKK